MAVYDLAHALGKALKESEEYQSYQEVCEKIKKDPQAQKMIKEYQSLSWVIQTNSLMGQEVKPEDQEKFAKLDDLVKLNDMVQRYLKAENRLGIILQDLQKIIMGSIEVGVYEEDGGA